MITTAIAGLRDGMKPMNEEKYFCFEYWPSTSFAAVPVFPAIV